MVKGTLATHIDHINPNWEGWAGFIKGPFQSLCLYHSNFKTFQIDLPKNDKKTENNIGGYRYMNEKEQAWGKNYYKSIIKPMNDLYLRKDRLESEGKTGSDAYKGVCDEIAVFDKIWGCYLNSTMNLLSSEHSIRKFKQVLTASQQLKFDQIRAFFNKNA